MKIPSRRMHHLPPSSFSLTVGLMLGLLLLGWAILLFYLAISKPALIGGIILMFVVLVFHLNARAKRHFARLFQSRTGESICHFAQSIDCRKVDSWVVRATFEELQRALRSGYADAPVRVTDQLEKDLLLDTDDLDDLIPDISFRTRRSLARIEFNPYFKQTITVGDLVHLIDAQPRITEKPRLR